jgi:hypothetical protein
MKAARSLTMTLAAGALLCTLQAGASSNATQPKVVAKPAAGFTVAHCAAAGWCEVTLAGRRVLAIAEAAQNGRAQGLCLRGAREDLLHIATSLKAYPHETRSGAVCVFSDATALPANPATRADGAS